MEAQQFGLSGSRRMAAASPKRTHCLRCYFATMDLRCAGSELTQCGQIGLLPSQRMQVQKPLARTAHNSLRRGDIPQTGHWFGQKRVKSKLTLRCGLPQQSRRGQTGLMHARLLLMQHFLALQQISCCNCSLLRRSGHSMLLISLDFKLPFAAHSSCASNCTLRSQR